MPDTHTNKLKTSLLVGLFVFLYPWLITIYCLLFWFITAKRTSNTVSILQSASQKTERQKKHLPFLQKFTKAHLNITVLSKSCLKKSIKRKNHLKYTLQKRQNSKAYLKYTFKVLEGILHIQRSFQKHSEILNIYPLYLHKRVFLAHFQTFEYIKQFNHF